MVAVATVLLVALGAVVGTAGPAAAHATLLETTPADDSLVGAVPAAVELRYSEAIDFGSGGVEVYDPGGDRVDRGSVDMSEESTVASVPIDDGGQGTYTVAWRVTSDDGHTITGSFVFHVGTETGGVAIDDSTPAVVKIAGFAGRWLAFAGSLVVLGTLLVGLLLATTPRGAASGEGAGPSAGAVGVAGPGIGTTSAGDVRERAERRLRQFGMGAAVLAMLGSLLALLATAAEATGRGLGGALGLVGDFVSDQRTGGLGALRVGFLIIAGVALTILRGRSAATIAALATVGSMVMVSFAGHAWTTSPTAVTVASDVIHQVAVGIWVGGVVALLAVLGLAVPADRTALGRRFSQLALLTVVVVGVTGTFSAWAQIRGLDALVDTTYGRLMTVKVAAFLVLVVLGWLNRSRLLATVERTIAPLGRSLRVETAVAVVVLGVTAGLVAQQPARVATSSGPFEATVTDADGTREMDIVVDPAKPGANEIHLYFYDLEGQPADVLAVEIAAATGDLPPRDLEVTPVTTTHVSVLGASLSSAGDWDLTITAVGADGTRATFTLEVPIR
jgi:copper transport protein